MFLLLLKKKNNLTLIMIINLIGTAVICTFSCHTKQQNTVYKSADGFFNWMIKRRFVPKSLDNLRGHKV